MISGDSAVVGRLPRGCQLCARGSKLVLFVTGLCDSACVYCPLSSERAGRDKTYADEVPVTSESDILNEAEAIGAEGAGVSGGDPMCRLERTVGYIRLLKSHMGDDFHVHLYTSKTDLDMASVSLLADSGLDEIRFHPQNSSWNGITSAIERGLTTGIEVPAIPSGMDTLKTIALKAEEIGVAFLNVNELEASETNFQRLVSLGMRLSSLDGANIEGSSETAHTFVDWAGSNLSKLSVHYCSAAFKDGVQMRNRLERRLKRTIREFEVADDAEPLLILGVIRASDDQSLTVEQLAMLRHILARDFEVPNELMNTDIRRMRVEIAAWVLEEIATDLKRVCEKVARIETGIVHEYPSWDRLQTLFEPV